MASPRPLGRVAAAALGCLIAAVMASGPAVAVTLLATNDSYSVRHDHTLSVAAPGVLANDVKLLGGDTAVRDTLPAHGSVVLNANGGFTYIPAAGYVGTDSFQYHVQSGLLSSLPATVTITVTNEAPVGVADSYTATTGVTLSVPAPGVLSNDTDADGDTLTVVWADESGNGSLDVKPDGSFTFTSGGGFSGDRTFTYRASDSIASSAMVTVTITVGSPGATPTPAPTPTPLLPTLPPILPTLPPVLPTLPPILQTLPPILPTQLPEATPTPTPSRAPGTSEEPTRPGASAEARPGSTDGPFGGPGGAIDPAAGSGGGMTGRSPGDVLAVPADEPFDPIEGIDVVSLTGVDWAVPSLALSVPGLLLILAVLAQGSVGVATVPFVRRWLGGGASRRRREHST